MPIRNLLFQRNDSDQKLESKAKFAVTCGGKEHEVITDYYYELIEYYQEYHTRHKYMS